MTTISVAFAVSAASSSSARSPAVDQAADTGATGHPLRSAMVRGLAFFLGLFTLLNLATGEFPSGFDGNVWWIDLSSVAYWIARPFLALVATTFLAWSIAPSMSQWRQRITTGIAALALVMALVNCVGFYRLLIGGALPGAFPLPFSLFVVLGLVSIGRATLQQVALNGGGRRQRTGVMISSVVTAAILFPVLQMICFGPTDYRRQSDAVVVFGARAYADGSASQPLLDRVRTACELYHAGLAPILIFSGGPADGSMHETRAMRRIAISLGVPSSAIILDSLGLDTRSTVLNSLPLLRHLGARRVMAVSNFYHLPRIKMAYQQSGMHVHTVPATEDGPLPGLWLYMGREVVALWGYFVEGLG